MHEISVITVPFSENQELFETDVLKGYLKSREVLRAEPHFFVYRGKPYWSVYLETRTLRGAETRLHILPAKVVATTTAGEVSSAAPAKNIPEEIVSRGARRDEARDSARVAFLRLLKEQDEIVRARYERLVVWRRQTAENLGIPVYVVITNEQALAIARQAPTTLQGLRQVEGVGQKRVEQHGKIILEILHGSTVRHGTEQPEVVRALDGDDQMVDAAHDALPQNAATDADQPHREHSAGDTGTDDISGVQQGSSEAHEIVRSK